MKVRRLSTHCDDVPPSIVTSRVSAPPGAGRLDALDGRLRGQPGARLDFSSVYRTWFREVTRWIRSFGGPDADVEDLAQEVFLVVRRKLSDFDGANLPGWLYRIAQLTVSDYRRRAWFVHLFKGRAPLLPDEPGPAHESPAHRLERKEEQRLLHMVLQKIHATRRETFVLYEILGYTGDEIARLQNVPVNTVWTRLHHARKDFLRLCAALPEGAAATMGEEHDDVEAG